jgi:hypothetical protein
MSLSSVEELRTSIHHALVVVLAVHHTLVVVSLVHHSLIVVAVVHGGVIVSALVSIRVHHGARLRVVFVVALGTRHHTVAHQVLGNSLYDREHSSVRQLSAIAAQNVRTGAHHLGSPSKLLAIEHEGT